MRLEHFERLFRRLAWMALLLLAEATLAQTPAAGRLLVATPEMTDARFAESVLLMLHHESDGSLAVLLNRPTWLEPADVFPQHEPLASLDGRVFLGGPVGPTQLLLLLRSPVAPDSSAAPIVDDVYVSTDLTTLTGSPFDEATESTVRLYAGRAVWEPGQLEAEIAAGAWQVVHGRGDHVFAADPLRLWGRVSSAEPELIVGR